MQYPVIHLNGSDALDLLTQYTDAFTAVQAAITAVGKIECNGRDYYTISSTAASDAIRWKRQRMEQLTASRSRTGGRGDACRRPPHDNSTTKTRGRSRTVTYFRDIFCALLLGAMLVLALSIVIDEPRVDVFKNEQRN